LPTTNRYFYQLASEQVMEPARHVIVGERFLPGISVFVVFEPPGACPTTWHNQPNTARYKAHCFISNCGKLPKYLILKG